MRLTESGRPPVPPAPPPPVPNPSEPVTFDDAGPEPVRPTFMSGTEDRVMESMNHRPRRLAGPAAAVAAVVVLIVVLVVTGLHSNSSPHHGGAATATTSHTHPPPTRHQTTTTTSTAPPTVSEPQGGTAHTATYQVTAPSYSLSVAATAGECWVEATDTANGSVLFTATLFPGQSHTIAASGPVTVIAGAPGLLRGHRERFGRHPAAGLPGALHADVPDDAVHRVAAGPGPPAAGAGARPSVSRRKASTRASSFQAS